MSGPLAIALADRFNARTARNCVPPASIFCNTAARHAGLHRIPVRIYEGRSVRPPIVQAGPGSAADPCIEEKGQDEVVLVGRLDFYYVTAIMFAVRSALVPCARRIRRGPIMVPPERHRIHAACRRARPGSRSVRGPIGSRQCGVGDATGSFADPVGVAGPAARTLSARAAGRVAVVGVEARGGRATSHSRWARVDRAPARCARPRQRSRYTSDAMLALSVNGRCEAPVSDATVLMRGN